MAERPSRKLAVILHADVVGSTKLVQRDELLMHERIQDSFRRFSEAIKNLHATEWISKPELLAAAYTHTGQVDKARKIITAHIESIAPEMTRLPDNWLDYFAERCPYVREEDVAPYLSGLEAAVR